MTAELIGSAVTLRIVRNGEPRTVRLAPVELTL
jgi:hypothetical protein